MQSFNSISLRRVTALCAALLLASSAAAAPQQPTPAAQAAFEQATALAKEKDKQVDATIAAFAEAIEADPDFAPAHEALTKFVNDLKAEARRNKDVQPVAQAAAKAMEEKYAVWEKKFPDSTGVQFALGSRYVGAEDPRARPYLLKVVARDPGFAKAWSMLSSDADRWGDEKASSDYMLKASQAEPTNPDYAFYYASGMGRVAPGKWEAASLDIARRFPTSDRGAQALYWLAQRAANDAKRIAIYERVRADFPIAKFVWTGFSIDPLYEAYLRTAPEKAVALAQEMSALGEKGQDWAPKVEFAQAFRDASAFAAAGQFKEASALLDKLPVDRRSSNPARTLILKAKITAGTGNLPAAYDSIVQQFSQSPADELRAALKTYGKQLGKTDAQINADVWAVRDTTAKPAPAFDLGLYTSDQKLSLASLHGKVVFITFWFPGCGPCRGEFPNFENIMAKFHGKDVVYLGINGLREQDDYVQSFMAGTKYSFIPLKGEEAVTGTAGYAVRGYPSNFLIDRNGRVVFSNFRASDPETELVLQRMIESLLDRPGA